MNGTNVSRSYGKSSFQSAVEDAFVVFMYTFLSALLVTGGHISVEVIAPPFVMAGVAGTVAYSRCRGIDPTGTHNSDKDEDSKIKEAK